MSDRVYTYPYSQDYHPSMPVIEIGLSRPGHDQTEIDLKALIDSGSDGTLIPIDILEEVEARQIGEARIRGILGASQPVDVYLVSIHIGAQIIQTTRVVAAPEDDEIILGRNVLNYLVVTLNGPANATEILS